MSSERAMTRTELRHLLEHACAMEEARVTGGGISGLARPGVAPAGSAAPAAARGSVADPASADVLRTWLGSPIRFRRVIRSDVTLSPDDLPRLTELLEELGGLRPRDAAIEATRETDDGVRVEIRPDDRGTRIDVTSDRRPEAVGAAVGVTSLAVVGGLVLGDAVGHPGTAGTLGVWSVAAVGGWMGLRLHLASAAARWQMRLDAVSARAATLVRRAEKTTSPHTGPV